MKRSRDIVNKTEKKPPGRPRTVSGDDDARAVAVRLPPKVLAVVDEYAAEMHITRSVAVRDMLTHAIDEWAKIKKRKPKGGA